MANVIWNNSGDSMASTAGAPKEITVTDAASAAQLSRIADSLDIIIRMIREDQEESRKRWAESEKD